MKEMEKIVFGMVHLLPLPGTARYSGGMEQVYQKALSDADALVRGGVQGIIVENDGDQPYSSQMDLEQCTAQAAVASLIRRQYAKVQLGISAAFNDYRSGLAIASAVQADFVRIPVFVDTVVCFCGTISPCCDKAMKYRRHIAADQVKIFADVQVKHAHMLLPEIPVEESVSLAQASGADAVIVTGTGTGIETPIETVNRAKSVAKVPVYIGSGTTSSNAAQQLEIADGAIVGTYFKTDGFVDVDKVKKFMGVLK